MSNLNFKLNLLLFVGQFITNNISRATPSIKNVVRTLRYRTAWYSDDHGELERVFKGMRDPWNFETSPYERERLRILLSEVAQFPRDRICEVGCAEGVFTQMISRVFRHVTAIDVSPTAVGRARHRCPSATYVVASLESFRTDRPFDVVVCAETLYYIGDVASAISQLSALGRYCVVSYIEREAKTLDGYFANISIRSMKRYEIGSGIFKRKIVVIVWENPPEQEA